MLFASVFLLVWFVAALSLSLSGWFGRYSTPALFEFGTVATASGFTLLYLYASRFRGFIRACSMKTLTLAQVLRLYGVLAFVEADEHVLPRLFAIPTGVIDVFFALTSCYVAARLVSPAGHPKRGFVAWHVAGVMGIAVSVITAMLTYSARFGLVEGGVTTRSMDRFPISIVPTFVGPVVLIAHFLALAAAHQHYLKIHRPYASLGVRAESKVKVL
jgi:hypothetical protein